MKRLQSTKVAFLVRHYGTNTVFWPNHTHSSTSSKKSKSTKTSFFLFDAYGHWSALAGTLFTAVCLKTGKLRQVAVETWHRGN